MCKLHICMYICVYATYMCMYAFVTSTRVFVDAAHIHLKKYLKPWKPWNLQGC